MIVDLAQEEELSIAQAIRPADLPPKVREYLNPRRVISYTPSDAASPEAEQDSLASVL